MSYVKKVRHSALLALLVSVAAAARFLHGCGDVDKPTGPPHSTRRSAAVSTESATLGSCSAPFDWPIVAVHLQLLRNGKVLSWGKVGDPYVWNRATNTFTPRPSASHLFCSGHSFLPDGRLLVTGGHIDDDRGLPDANIFDPATETWTRVANMARGRWYPTNTTLPNGELLTIAGADESATNVGIPEVWKVGGG